MCGEFVQKGNNSTKIPSIILQGTGSFLQEEDGDCTTSACSLKVHLLYLGASLDADRGKNTFFNIKETISVCVNLEDRGLRLLFYLGKQRCDGLIRCSAFRLVGLVLLPLFMMLTFFLFTLLIQLED